MASYLKNYFFKGMDKKIRFCACTEPFALIIIKYHIVYVPNLNMETRNDLTLCNRSFHALLLLRSCANLKTIKHERNLK